MPHKRPKNPTHALVKKVLLAFFAMQTIGLSIMIFWGVWADPLVSVSLVVFSWVASGIILYFAFKAIINEERLYLRLRNLMKLNSLGQFNVGVARELTNPLTFINGFNGRLRQELLKGREAMNLRTIQEHLEEMEGGIFRMSSIISRLQDFANVKESHGKSTLINDSILHSLKLFSDKLMEEGIQIQTELDPEFLRVLGDMGRIEEVFFNLLANSRDALVSGKQKRGKTIQVKSYREDNFIIVSFTDSGHGIQSQHLKYIFEPFFTTKSPEFNLGLGLSLSREIIEGYGGKIFVVSDPSVGTTFILKFIEFQVSKESIDNFLSPTTPIIPLVNKIEVGVVPAGISKRPRILIVDDEPILRTTLQEFLTQDIDAEVFIAEHGKEALKILKTHSPQLIISDINMPEMNGIEFIQQLRQKNILTPVIFLTAYGSKEVIMQAIQLGVVDFVEKPFGNFEITEMILKHLNLIEGFSRVGFAQPALVSGTSDHLEKTETNIAEFSATAGMRKKS